MYVGLGGQNDGIPYEGVTDANGNYSFLTPPSYTPETVSIEQSVDGGAVFIEMTAPVSVTQNRTLPTLALPATVPMTVTVNDGNGNPVVGANVTANAALCTTNSSTAIPGTTLTTTSYLLGVTTDASGTATFPVPTCAN